MSLLCLVYLFYWWQALNNPNSIAFEGHVLYASWQLWLGKNIYSPLGLTAEPWSVIIYPPLFMILGAPVVGCFGAGFPALRALSMLSTAAAAAGLYRLTRACGASLASALVALAFFLSLLPVFVCSTVVRVDMLALALGIWASERFVRAWSAEKNGMSSYLDSVVVATLSTLAKFQSIVYVLAIVVFALWNGRRKLALQWLVSWALASYVCAAVAQVLTGGYLEHMTYLTQSGWSLDMLWLNIRGLGPDLVKIFIGLAVLLAAILRGSVTGLEKFPYCLLAICSVSLFFSMGIPASSSNHMLSCYFALTWWLALALSRLPAVVSIIVLAFSIYAVTEVAAMGQFLNRLRSDPQEVVAVLEGAHVRGGTMLTEEPRFAIVCGAKNAMVDPGTFMSAWKNDPGRMEALTDAIRKRKYAAIIINELDSKQGGDAVRWPRAVVAAVHDCYKMAARAEGNGLPLEIYLPDTTGRQPAHPDAAQREVEP